MSEAPGGGGASDDGPGAERDGSGDLVVYKICSRSAWLSAKRLGELEPSADDRRDGFLHLSSRRQVRGTLDKHFAGRADLVLLSVAVSAFAEGDLRWEVSRGGQRFPHLYAALRVDQVSDVVELPLEGGSHRLPPAFRFRRVR